MRGEPQDYLNTVNRIEPDVHPLDRDGALASIAISQKRQADALERIANALGVGISDAHPASTILDHLFEFAQQGRR